ncbi:hypothetical protein BASA62_009738 [Batrachochytrium salamandrivorans]|nr:hypothetical protein BASA62_009738 [Batrachochytrium salamandrivorans]
MSDSEVDCTAVQDACMQSEESCVVIAPIYQAGLSSVVNAGLSDSAPADTTCSTTTNTTNTTTTTTTNAGVGITAESKKNAGEDLGDDSSRNNSITNDSDDVSMVVEVRHPRTRSKALARSGGSGGSGSIAASTASLNYPANTYMAGTLSSMQFVPPEMMNRRTRSAGGASHIPPLFQPSLDIALPPYTSVVNPFDHNNISFKEPALSAAMDVDSNDTNIIMGRSRRKRPRNRRHINTIVSECSDIDTSDVDRGSPGHSSGKLGQVGQLVLGASKVLGKGSDLPTEERPYHDFFPDLMVDRPIPIIRYDWDSSVTSQCTVKKVELDVDGTLLPQSTTDNMGLAVLKPFAQGDVANGVSPPRLSVLPPLSLEAFKSQLINFLRLEPSEDDLAERVEYDMDEQDRAWLNTFNAERRQRCCRICTEDLFEAVMDHIEKEWFDLTKDLPKTGKDETAYPEDISCAVCDDGEAENSNAIVFCDGCNLAVHQDCYGVPFIPEGQWLCRKCMLSPETPVSCMFCPIEGGAFKQTSTNKWVHLNCAMWIPECHIANTVYMEPVEGTENVPKSRWRLICYICKQRYGAPIQCSNKYCFIPFHASCARKAKLYMRMRGVHNSDPNSFRAYCDKHAPKEYRDVVDVEATTLAAQEELSQMRAPSNLSRKRAMSGPSSDIMHDFDTDHFPIFKVPGFDRNKRPAIEASNDDSNEHDKANGKTGNKSTPQGYSGRKSLEPPRLSYSPSVAPTYSHSPSLSLATPCIPYYILQQVLNSTSAYIPKKKDDIVCTIARYWSLKRESRRGAALLKRLHLEPWTTTASAHKEDEEFKMKKYELLGVLRRDLERVRLLIELVRKREKEKEKICKVQQEYVEKLLNPLSSLLRPILEQLKHHDRSWIFAYPVSVEDAPDYPSFVKFPMDFTTMTQKLDKCEYLSVDDFQMDLDLIINNCLLYNKPDTIYSRAAIRLRKYMTPIIQSLRERAARRMTKDGLLATTIDHTGILAAPRFHNEKTN